MSGKAQETWRNKGCGTRDHDQEYRASTPHCYVCLLRPIRVPSIAAQQNDSTLVTVRHSRCVGPILSPSGHAIPQQEYLASVLQILTLYAVYIPKQGTQRPTQDQHKMHMMESSCLRETPLATWIPQPTDNQYAGIKLRVLRRARPCHAHV